MAAAVIAALAITSACASDNQDETKPNAAASEVSDEVQQRIDAAKQAGEFKLILGVFLSQSAADALVDGFKKYYDLDIPVELAVGVDNQELGGQVVQSNQAGTDSPTDVQMNTVAGVATTVSEKIANPLDWSWAPNIAELDIKEVEEGDKHAAVRAVTYVQGFTYNTERMSEEEVPKTLDDVLTLDEKFSVATTPFAAGFGAQFTDALWGREKMFDWAERFEKTLDGFIDCGEVERIASGEFDMQVYNCGVQETLALQKKGAPVDFVIPTDVAYQSYLYLQVPPNAANPAAAELFINWMLSPEAQSIMWEQSNFDLTDLKSSKMAGALKKSSGDAEVLQVDIAFREANKEAYDEAEAIEDIFAGKGR